MQQYTVYAIRSDALGEPSVVTPEDRARYEAIIAEEIARAGMSHEVRVLVTDDRSYSELPLSGSYPELEAVLETAWERFIRGEQAIR